MNSKLSNIHLTVGIAPGFRINGQLTAASLEVLKSEDTRAMVESMVNDRQKQLLEEYGELDLSYSLEDGSRFRVNIFKQKGDFARVLRLVNTVIPSAQSLGVPSSVY